MEEIKNKEIEKLRKIYVIKEKERNTVVNNILNEITYGKNEKSDYCNILVGPPASGKSTLSDSLIEQDNNLVRINGDFIRNQYPNYKEISKLYPTEVFVILKDEMKTIKDKIISYLISKGYAFNKEYSLNYIDSTLNLTKELHNLGYNINYYLLLTSPLELHLRAIERFFAQLKNGTIPRIVAVDRQEYAIQQMQNLIDRLEKKLINTIKLIDTDGNIYNIENQEIKNKTLFELINKNYIKNINVEKITNRIKAIEENMNLYKNSLNEKVIKRISDHMTIIKKELDEE